MHTAAKYGELNTLPPETLTAKALTQKNDAGYTPLHHAAIGGHLDQVPAAILTAENLNIRSNAGYSVFHTPHGRGLRAPRPDPGEPPHPGGLPQHE
jgi:hypothetical protein